MKSSIWPKSSNTRVDRSLAAHSVMALAISALLFIVCLSGTLAVFEDELGWWEYPATPSVSSVTPEAAQSAMEAGLAMEPDSSHLYLYLPRDNWPRFVVATDNSVQTANADGELVGPYESAWNDFLIHMHYYLHLPESFGMIFVAILGVMLVAMSISGFLAHPRIFRDAFRLKRSGQPRLIQADLHNRLSVWTAPFHILVAATGAVIGLFVVVAYLLAVTSYNGDTQALSNAIFGAEAAPDETPSDMPDLAMAMQNMAIETPDTPPFLVVVHDPGTVGQHIGIYGEHTDRLIYGETYEFDASGTFLGVEGSSNGALGQQIASSVYRLHFGDFGGLIMKVAYFILGALLCIIVASGMNIYFLKAKEKGRAKPRLEAAWAGFVWGSSALFAITLIAALLGAPSIALTYVFWIGAIVLTGLSAWKGQNGTAGRIIRAVLGLSMVVSAILHAALHADTYANVYIALTSLALLLGGLGFLVEPGARLFGQKEKTRLQHS